MTRFASEYGVNYNEKESGSLECEIQKIGDVLFNLPFDKSVEELTKTFKENICKLKDYMDKIDILSKELDIKEHGDPARDKTIDKLDKTLESYTELAKLQGHALGKLCSLYSSGDTSYKPFGEQEYNFFVCYF